MSDPNPAVADPQSRALFRSLVLDPALLFARVLDAEDLARARRRGGRARPATGSSPPWSPSPLFLVPGPQRRPLLPRRRRPAAGLARRPRAARLLARHRRLLQGPPAAPRGAPAPAGPRHRRRPPGARPRRPGCSTAAAWSSPTARRSACPTPPRTRPRTPSTAARSRAAASRSPGSSS